MLGTKLSPGKMELAERATTACSLAADGCQQIQRRLAWGSFLAWTVGNHTYFYGQGRKDKVGFVIYNFYICAPTHTFTPTTPPTPTVYITGNIKRDFKNGRQSRRTQNL